MVALCFGRFARHQFFKPIIYKLRNFKSIKKTLAYNHQQHFFLSPTSLVDDISYGKSSPFIVCENIDEFVVHLKAMQFTNKIIEDACVVKSFKCNNRHFKPGLLIAKENIFYEITHILSIQDDKKTNYISNIHCYYCNCHSI